MRGRVSDPVERDMNCIKFEEMLSDYVDGLLAHAAQGQFAEHALSCRACRALLDDVKSAVGECKQAFEVETPFELDLALVRRSPKNVPRSIVSALKS